jgi:hypothetical protein
MQKVLLLSLPLIFLCQATSQITPQKASKKPSITQIKFSPPNNTIQVSFKTATAGIPDIQNSTKWTVVIFYDDKPPANLTPAEVQQDKSLDTSMDLTMSNVSWDHVTSLAVSFEGTQALAQPPAKQAKSYFTAAAQQSDADNSLTGSYSPAIHSATQYTISGLGTVAPQVSRHLYLGGTASVETDNRPSADPDSFFVSALAQWIPRSSRFLDKRAQGVLINWDIAGLQFDRSTTTKTFVSSAMMEIPLLIYPAPFKTSKFGAGLFPYVGISAGSNLSNSLQPGGSGFVFDGVVGGLIDLTFKLPSATWLQKVELTGTDTLRIPATDEIFTYTHYISQTGKTVSLPALSTKVRNHVKGELDLTVAKPFSISIQYEDGELPPAYKTINNKVTIGIKVALQQATGAQSKVSINTESQ